MRFIGVDTGGTFTDFICREPHGVRVHKVLSTPDDPARAVLDGLRTLLSDALDQPGAFGLVHGSTVATNAILERKGVPTALVVNAGFEDLLEIGRQNREHLFDLEYARPPGIVAPHRRFGAPGRMAPDIAPRDGGPDAHQPGAVRQVQGLDPDQARELASRVAASGATSAAVCLLFSFADPAHERLLGRALAEQGLDVSLSHEIIGEFREYERASTTVVNAHVAPVMTAYLDRLREAVGEGLSVMQSNGGSISADTAGSQAVRTIVSGPAGGAVGAMALGRQAGFHKLITFDMGGTSTDVCCMDGRIPMTGETVIGGCPVKVPMIDIHTVGAGGGSMARMDAGGALVVGPESAGADPGPICYGKGDTVTVTDANLYLGRLLPGGFLGGEMTLDTQGLEAAFADLARGTGLTPIRAAEGVVEVALANMERAVRLITVERGHDPAEFTLVAFGGAGGLHAALLAQGLSIPRVLVPANPGILSALGMLMADVVRDYSRTVMLSGRAADSTTLAGLFAPLEDTARQEMTREGLCPDDLVLEYGLDMRYQGQSFELTVDLPGPRGAELPSLAEAFGRVHEDIYGYRHADAGVEVVNIRLRARGRRDPLPGLQPRELQGPDPAPRAWAGSVDAVFAGRRRRAAVLLRRHLEPGNQCAGPAVVAEYTSTTVVPPGWRARVDAQANLVMEPAPS